MVVSDPRHTLLKSHRSKTGIIYSNHENNVASLLSHQWLRCNSCTWAHDEQSCNGTSCAEGIICHIATAVAGRVHCFHQPRPQSIFFKTLRFPLIAKRCAIAKRCTGNKESLQLHGLFLYKCFLLLVINQCK